MKLARWTPLTFCFPKRYLSDDDVVTSLDFYHWSRHEYTWEQDGWNGYKDFLTPPPKVVAHGNGDCEDYAFVAASWAHARGKDVTLSLCFEGMNPIPQHMVAAFDGNVYSSDGIRGSTSIDEYIEASQYDWAINRKI